MGIGENLYDLLRRYRLLMHTIKYFSSKPVFFRLNISSDCCVQFYSPKIVCVVCGGDGHTKVKCDYVQGKTSESFSVEDVLFYSFVHPEDTPGCLMGVQ